MTATLYRPQNAAAPFIVYSLPRSRTAWLAAFLTYGDWRCTHDQAMTMRSIADVRELLARPNFGTVETGVAPGWRLIEALRPGIRQVVIRRPVEEAIESTRQLDLAGVAVFDWAKLRRHFRYMDRCLDQIAARPGVLTVEFADLAHADAAAAVFEHCLPYAFDVDWWHRLRDVNIQIDVKAQLRYYLANLPAIDGFKRTCWRELRRMAERDRAATRRAA